MSGLVERLRSLRITTQIAILVAATLALTHVLIATAVFVLYPPPDPMLSPEVAIFRVGLIAKLLDAAASPDQRADLARIAQREIPGLVIGELPPQARIGPLGLDLHGDRSRREGVMLCDVPGSRPLVAIKLRDGGAIMTPLPPPPRFPGLGPLSIAVAFLACVFVPLTMWATRTMIAPLTRFTEAAERFTLGRPDLPLSERGPPEIVRPARAFNGMRERIQRLVEARAHMLAAVSHDLRTPITRLRLRAENIEPSSLKMQVIRDLDIMQSMVHMALSFLRDQTSRGKQERIDLPSLIHTICDDYVDMGHEIVFEEGLHSHVDGDPEQLARAVSNLIENAFKFGKTVTITLRAGENRTVDVDVRDDGPGIPDEDKRRVLEPFYRGDHARGLNNHGGFGLGLSISQVIAEAHSGSLSLHDAEPAGLIARLTLPMARRNPDVAV